MKISIIANNVHYIQQIKEKLHIICNRRIDGKAYNSFDSLNFIAQTLPKKTLTKQNKDEAISQIITRTIKLQLKSNQKFLRSFFKLSKLKMT